LLLAVAFCQPSSYPNAACGIDCLKADGCFAWGYLSSAAYEIERGAGAIS
jgi:hypothetical protein